MSGLKNSPFGKRLRASRQERDEEDGLSPKKPRVNPIFGSGTTSSSSTPALDSRPTTSDSSGPDSPVEFHGMSSALSMPRIAKDYGDRFVPSKDSGDLRTSYHLMEDGGPSTPSKNRIIPTESDALKGTLLMSSCLAFPSDFAAQNKPMRFSTQYCTLKSHLHPHGGLCHRHGLLLQAVEYHRQRLPDDVCSPITLPVDPIQPHLPVALTPQPMKPTP